MRSPSASSSLLLCRRLFASSAIPEDVLAQASRDLQRAFTPAVADCLVRNGAAIVDSALSPAVTRPLLEEFRALHRSAPHLLRPNCTHFIDPSSSAPGSSPPPKLLEKPGILEAEATLDAEARARLPLWAAVADSGDLRALLSVHLGPALERRRAEREARRRWRRGQQQRQDGTTPPPPPPPIFRPFDAQTVKLQRNDGSGGAFPVHCDADEGLPGDGRAVTCILYLTDPSGYDAARHGGQLRLYPLRPPAFPEAAGAAAAAAAAGGKGSTAPAAPSPPRPVAVDVEPREGRLVLFSSARMPHRVLPAWGGRVRECATFWVGRSEQRRAAAPAREPPAAAAGALASSSPPPLPLEEQLETLLSPRLRQVAARALLAGEWEASQVESHAPGPERDAAMASHARALGASRAAVERLGLGDALAALAGGESSSAAAAAQAAAEDMDWF